MIFHSSTSLLLPAQSQLSAIRTGLNNWKSIWNRRSLNNDERFFDVLIATVKDSNTTAHKNIPPDEPSMWKRSGFWRHAPEYWLLASLGLDQSERAMSAPQQRHYVLCDAREGDTSDQQLEDMSMSRVKSMIWKFEKTRGELIQ